MDSTRLLLRIKSKWDIFSAGTHLTELRDVKESLFDTLTLCNTKVGIKLCLGGSAFEL